MISRCAAGKSSVAARAWASGSSRWARSLSRTDFASAELAPGLTVHAVGGHSAGLQFVRVKTRRGFVVLASDVTHFYENMASSRPFTTAFHIGDMLEGFDRLLALAPDENHIVPGHDPLVMKLYPAPGPELEGVAVRLDVSPSGVAPSRAGYSAHPE